MYTITFFGRRILVSHEAIEGLLAWLFVRTGCGNLREAIEIAWMNEEIGGEDIERLKKLKKLFVSGIEGRIRAKINLTCLYEDVAAMRYA